MAARVHEKNPDHPSQREFRRRVASIRFDEAESWARQADLEPTSTEPKRLALQRFREAESELRDLLKPPAPDDSTTRRVLATLGRLLSEVDDREPSKNSSRLEEALALLENAGEEKTVDDKLLQIDLLRRLGKLDDAERRLKAISQVPQAPPRRLVLPVQVRLAVARQHFDEALKELKATGESLGPIGLLRVETRLAQRKALAPGPQRQEAERGAFEQVEALRDANDLDYRLALFRLTREVNEPASTLPPRFWGVLAEGRFLLGQPDEAARLWTVGAAHAESDRRGEVAWNFRYRAAAAWYDAGKFARAAALFHRIEQSPSAGSLRPKSGLLRSAALRRLWEGEPSPARRRDYLAALHEQIDKFPTDPTAGEARFSLGMAQQENGEESEAMATFEKVPAGHARRLDALRAIALILRRRLEAVAPIGDPELVRQMAQTARNQLEQAQSEFSDPAARAEIDLDLARLELIPQVSALPDAKRRLDKLRGGPLRPETRTRADVVQVERFLRQELFPEAERQARLVLEAAGDADLIDLAEFVDSLASETTSDVMLKRCGGILEQVADRLRSRSPTTTAPRLRERLGLWKIRGLLFRGDTDSAARQAPSLLKAAEAAPNTRLRADTLLRLGDFPGAERLYRRLGQETDSGSLPWFAARYGLAATLAKKGDSAAAKRLIDGTALLNPDLGGPVLKSRFERLLRRLKAR